MDNEDGIHRISVSKFGRFYLQNDENESFPECASQRVRYALVFVSLEDRKAVGVKYIDYGVITFNNEGKLDEEVYRRSLKLAADMLLIYYPKKEEGVIDASGRFARKQHQQEFRWTPTPEIKEALVRAIFGINNDDEPKIRKEKLAETCIKTNAPIWASLQAENSMPNKR